MVMTAVPSPFKSTFAVFLLATALLFSLDDMNFYVARRSSSFFVRAFSASSFISTKSITSARSIHSVSSSSTTAGKLGFQRQQQYYHPSRITKLQMSSTKPGVASLDELQAMVDSAGDKLVVVDVRNPDPEVEPGDQKSLAVAALPSTTNRPQAIHAIWDRATNSMPMDALQDLPKDTPIITHCGGGGRGQKAKDYLQNQGFTNVLNGAGPKETDLWQVYGDK
jgi:rhodanese-related sulfurtransferase